jgi:hypothetical protein
VGGKIHTWALAKRLGTKAGRLNIYWMAYIQNAK